MIAVRRYGLDTHGARRTTLRPECRSRSRNALCATWVHDCFSCSRDIQKKISLISIRIIEQHQQLHRVTPKNDLQRGYLFKTCWVTRINNQTLAVFNQHDTRIRTLPGEDTYSIHTYTGFGGSGCVGLWILICL